MERNPLISVITVTFNAEDTIGKTLDSVKSQTFQDFEHLIIDGASKDNTLSILKDKSLSQTVVVSEPDKGLYDAMNKGLRKARGKYVIFLNAGDTFYSHDTLTHYAMKASENKDIIYGDTRIVNHEGDFIGMRHLSVPENLTKKSFVNGMLICHQAFMVKKDLTVPYDLSYRFSADYDWCINCIEKAKPGNCVNLKEITIDYLTDGLTDKNKIKSLKERFRIMSKHYGFIPTLFRHLGFSLRALKRGKL